MPEIYFFLLSFPNMNIYLSHLMDTPYDIELTLLYRIILFFSKKYLAKSAFFMLL